MNSLRNTAVRRGPFIVIRFKKAKVNDLHRKLKLLILIKFSLV